MPIVLDGRAPARRFRDDHVARAAAVLERRGRPPAVGIVAFAPHGEEPVFSVRKVRACEKAGVSAELVTLALDAGTSRVRDAVLALAASDVDGIFLELPFPDQVAWDPVVTAVPEALDVDVMTAARARRYLDQGEGDPPVTVTAALELLRAYDVDIAGRDGVLIAEPSPFAHMFRTALERQGARMRPLLHPDDAADGLDAALVVVSAGLPGLVRSGDIAEGAVVIDVGYFNPGGAGDIDLASGVEHLNALAPVPGSIGPMTISMLVRRVIEAAEGGIPG